MKNYKTLFKDIFREIWKTRSRFLSIMCIVMLGVGFFAGIKSTCPDMKETAQQYFAENNLMDNHIKSTMGFTENDIKSLQSQEDISAVEAGYTLDAFVKQDENTNMVARAYSFNAENIINLPVLQEGRLPEAANECLVENSLSSGTAYKIGSTVKLFLEDEPISDKLKIDTFTVVGIINSPLYINFERGNTTLGNGSVRTFMFIPEEAFSYEVFTDAYVKYKSTSEIPFYNKEYDELMTKKTDELSLLATKREKTRFDEIYNEASAKIEDAQAELDSGAYEYETNLNLFNSEIASAELKLKKASKKLESGKNALAENQTVYDGGMAQLTDGEAKLKATQEQLLSSRAETEKAKAELLGLEQLTTGVAQTIAQFKDISLPTGAEIPAEIAPILAASSGLNGFLEGAVMFPTLLDEYIHAEVGTPLKETFAAPMSSALAKANAQLESGKAELAAAEQQIAQGEAQLAPALATIAEKRTQLEGAKAQLESARTAISQGYIEYQSGMRELASKRAEGEQKLADAAATLASGRADLLDARHKLNDLPSPEWYIFERGANPGYSNFSEDAERVDNIAAVFPIFFILVAALVCLTTMTRMVEEQRTEIGTLKALGYSKSATITKYMVYALSASLIGSIFGLLIGFKLFPTVIFNAYRIMYIMPPIQAPFRMNYAIICTVAAMACTGVSAFAACAHELAETPAALMRPKAPQSGKRVFLERITPIWKHLSFLQKVTVRNLFRYKKRILMTIVGIAGCTALMMAGFGLRHAIFSIVDKQYGSIFTYDAMGIFDDKITADEVSEIKTQLGNEKMINESMLARQSSIEVSSGGALHSIFLFVPETPAQVTDFISMQHRTDGKPVTLDESGVVITEKIARLLDLKQGEEITVHQPDGASAKMRVSDITENYTMNFIYMTPKQYETAFKASVPYNAFVLSMADKTQEDALSQQLLQNNNILAVNYSSVGGKQFRDIVQSLNYIVLVLILCAGALAFVVLYNLANINVEERLREIATIKVLGFYDPEVSAYIYRENTISALMGMAIGLLLGVPFVHFIIKTAEVDAVMFNPTIDAASFIFAAALTFGFTLCVNLAMHFRLKKVDMVTSLKSIE